LTKSSIAAIRVDSTGFKTLLLPRCR